MRLPQPTKPNNASCLRALLFRNASQVSLHTMQVADEVPSFEGPEEVLRRIAEAARQSSLETNPIPSALKSDGYIPNTPLAASTISFLLGSVFAIGISIVVSGGYSYWWCTPQLGCFLASWAGFHWGEFAVTAGWNREKCSVDCESPCLVVLAFRLSLSSASFPSREWTNVSHCPRRRPQRIPGNPLAKARPQGVLLCLPARYEDLLPDNSPSIWGLMVIHRCCPRCPRTGPAIGCHDSSSDELLAQGGIP